MANVADLLKELDHAAKWSAAQSVAGIGEDIVRQTQKDIVLKNINLVKNLTYGAGINLTEKINEVLSTPNPTKALLSSLKEIVKPVLQQCRSNQEMRKALKHLCAGGSSDDLLGGQAMSRSNSLTG